MAAYRAIFAALVFFSACMCAAADAPAPGAAACPVRFGASCRPLLFGGINDPGLECTLASGEPCPKRQGRWTEFCSFRDPLVNKWACTAGQVAGVLDMAAQLHGGAPLEVAPCDIYTYLRGRTLWIIGDSHTKDFLRAIQCFMIDFWPDQRLCAPTANETLLAELSALPARRGEPKCIHLRGDARVCLVHAVLGDALAGSPVVADGGVLNLLRDYVAEPRDVIIINAGAWHHWLNGSMPEPDRMERYSAMLHRLGQWYQDNKGALPHVLFRESIMQHVPDRPTNSCQPGYPNIDWSFDAASGQLRTGAPGRRRRLLGPGGEPDGLEDAPTLLRGGALNAAAHEILEGYGMRVMGGHALSVPNHRAHAGLGRNYGFLDCQHYCSPGVPELILYELARDFHSGFIGAQPLGAGEPLAERPRECLEVDNVIPFSGVTPLSELRRAGAPGTAPAGANATAGGAGAGAGTVTGGAGAGGAGGNNASSSAVDHGREEGALLLPYPELTDLPIPDGALPPQLEARPPAPASGGGGGAAGSGSGVVAPAAQGSGRGQEQGRGRRRLSGGGGGVRGSSNVGPKQGTLARPAKARARGGTARWQLAPVGGSEPL